MRNDLRTDYLTPPRDVVAARDGRVPAEPDDRAVAAARFDVVALPALLGINEDGDRARAAGGAVVYAGGGGAQEGDVGGVEPGEVADNPGPANSWMLLAEPRTSVSDTLKLS